MVVGIQDKKDSLASAQMSQLMDLRLKDEQGQEQIRSGGETKMNSPLRNPGGWILIQSHIPLQSGTTNLN